MELNLRSSARQTSHTFTMSPPQEVNALTALRDAWDTPIAELAGSQKTQFWEVFGQVRALYNDPENYSSLYEDIRTKFIANEPGRTITPGTVGAYFGGCLVNSNGCSAVCAGSAPLPQNHQFCDSHVFFADFNNGFTFRRVYTAPDVVERTIIYVKANNMDEFQGFTQAEKAALEEYSVREVLIMNQHSSNETPRVIGGNDYVPLAEVKARAGTTRAVATTGYSGWAIFGLIVIIIIICVVIWLIVRESQKK